MSREDKIALYEKGLAALRDVALKGAEIRYTSINGNMFSYLAKDGTLALRLPEDARLRFLKKYKTGLCEQYGIVQKEYAVVPDALLKKTEELSAHFKTSYAYVGSLKPKPTTKKKKP